MVQGVIPLMNNEVSEEEVFSPSYSLSWELLLIIKPNSLTLCIPVCVPVI